MTTFAASSLTSLRSCLGARNGAGVRNRAGTRNGVGGRNRVAVCWTPLKRRDRT
jgi:hypothetical protein